MDHNQAEQMKKAAEDLDQKAGIQARLVDDVPNLDAPVFMVLNYSPGKGFAPASMAFDCQGDPKCWLSEPQVENIAGNGPKRHKPYRDFQYGGRQFYGYSIHPVPIETLLSARNVKEILPEFYAHMHT